MTESSADQLWRSAQLHMAAGDTATARYALESLLQRQPGHAAAHMTLSHIAWTDGRVRDATRHALEVAKEIPTDPSAILAVGMALLRVGEVVAARSCLEHPALLGASAKSLLMYHAGLRRQFGDDVRALALLDRAHEIGVDGAEFRFARGLELLFCGRTGEAEADFETSLRMDPAACAATLELARLRKQTLERNHLEDFDRRVHRIKQGTQDHAALEFARYKELEDLGRYEQAWNALQRANTIMRSLHPWERDKARQQVDRLIREFTRFTDPATMTESDGPQPIFIVGLPRSGTTLLDRLLGNHSQVVCAGELDDFSHQLCWAADYRDVLGGQMLDRLPELDYPELGRRYLMQTQWRARGKRFFTDKQPWNHRVAGLIHRALPNARILHMTRDPMGVCFSNFRALLGERYAYSNALDTLADHYMQYRRLHTHWQAIMPGRIHDVSYHDLVNNTEMTLRKVLDFCGLGWEHACLAPARGTGAISTLSAAQVREPIHNRAFEEWRHYSPQLASLRQALM